MSNYSNDYPNPYSYQNAVPAPTNNSQEMNLLWSAVKTGAMVGATGATALGIHQMAQRHADNKEVAKNIIKTTATVGIATGAATAVGTMLRQQPALALLASFATGTAVMYTLNQPEITGASTDE